MQSIIATAFWGVIWEVLGALLQHSSFHGGPVTVHPFCRRHVWGDHFLIFQPRSVFEGWSSVCCIFERLRMAWLPVLWVFNVHTHVNACDCIKALSEYCKSVFTESGLRERIPWNSGGLGGQNQAIPFIHSSFFWWKVQAVFHSFS